MIKRVLVFLRNFVYGVVFFPYVRHYKNRQNVVFTECYMSRINKRFVNNNWGDDLNKYLFEYVSNVNVVNLPFSKMLFVKEISPYSLIGSIITFYKLSNKIVYGTGVMNPQDRIRGVPNKIISVRGPRTRAVLVEHGIACPEKYGDPALLLPCFYKPKITRVNKGGLIVNMGTNVTNTSTVRILAEQLNLKTISMTEYDNWTDVVDEICSCDYIVSESLHGLIVAETYGIPNVWVEFTNHPSYWDFKFNDYYESIDKNEQIIKISEETSSNEVVCKIKQKIEDWEKASIDYDELLRLYPFEIKIPLIKVE